ncbi:hypothetical protein LTR10_014948 [Elasticomyces elasticus]|nr:hypothetical protein LTR10_014948 [Elasticomyces elasticus]KAK4964525.1 hypothetical protein LTR42_012821 [Elasticomyces elasticus]
MSWASARETSRVEDIAYSLIGLFDINMTLLYGEGGNAFLRLQEEIMKSSTDHSIFSWGYYYGHDPRDPRSTVRQNRTLLADNLTGPLAIRLRKTGATNVYEPSGSSETETPRTLAVPREIADATADSAILIRLRYDFYGSFHTPIPGGLQGHLRVNIIDTNKVAQVLKTWPLAHEQNHSLDLWKAVSSDASIAPRAIPNTTITFPPLATWQMARGVRIRLHPPHRDDWEVFYDLIVYHKARYKFLRSLERCRPLKSMSLQGKCAASSLVDLCADETFTVPMVEGREIKMSVLGLCVKMTVSTRSGMVNHWQVDAAITVEENPPFFEYEHATECVDMAAVAPVSYKYVFVARTVMKRRMASRVG